MRSLENYFPASGVRKYSVKISRYGEIASYWFYAYDNNEAITRLKGVRSDYLHSDLFIYWDTLAVLDPVTRKWFCFL